MRFIVWLFGWAVYSMVHKSLASRREAKLRNNMYAPAQSDSQMHWTAVLITGGIGLTLLAIPACCFICAGIFSTGLQIATQGGRPNDGRADQHASNRFDDDDSTNVDFDDDSDVVEREDPYRPPSRSGASTSGSSKPQSYDQAFKAIRSGGFSESHAGISWLSNQPASMRRDEVCQELITALSNNFIDTQAMDLLESRATVETCPALITFLEQHPQSSQADDVVKLLGKLRHLPAVPAMMRHAANGYSEARQVKQAVAALGVQAAPEVAPFMNDSNSMVRSTARDLMIKEFRATELVYPQIIIGLSAPELEVRRGALEWLEDQTVNQEYRSAVATAINPLLNDTDLRRDAVDVLEKWGGPENVAALVNRMESESNSYYAGKIAELLGKIGDPTAAEAIVKGLSDFSDRREAAAALRKMGADAEPFVLPYAIHSDRYTAQAACEILGDIGGEQSLDALERGFRHAQLNNWSSVVTSCQAAFVKVRQRVLQTPRTWTDATGAHKIEAQLIDFKEGKAFLRTTDGREIQLSINDLSQPDQAFVRRILKSRG